MSAQAGILFFDGRPITRPLCDSLDEQLHRLASDKRGRYTNAGLVMTQTASKDRPDAGVQQPYVSATGNVMTLDGRLDNRDDLARQLRHCVDQRPSDVALAMAAYEKWGRASFSRFIGDWSLVLWDAADRTLTFARDYMGARPLYVFADTKHVVWSTGLAALAVLTDRCSSLDDRFVVGCISLAPPPDLTPYLGIQSVTPAHAFTYDSAGTLCRRRFWTYPTHSIRYATPNDYYEHLRELFAQAVRDRLQQPTVWCELSGGLDSSSVVCMADALVRAGGSHTVQLETISWVTNSSPESDERRFIAEVEQHCDRRGHHLVIDALYGADDMGSNWVTPFAPAPSVRATYAHVAQAGGRLLLTGHGGDSVMGNYVEYPAAVAECLSRWHLPMAVSRAREWAKASRKTIWTVLAEGASCLLPARYQARSRIARACRLASVTALPTSHDFSATFLLRPVYESWWREELRRQTLQVAEYGNISKQPILASLQYFAESRSLQAPTEFTNVVTAHPFLDRRLVEYVLSIPVDILCPPGQPRAAMKHALEGLVPERILRRFSKGYAAPFILRSSQATMQDWLSQLDTLEIVSRGFVDRDLLRARLVALQSGSISAVGNLSLLVVVEGWLKSRMQRLATAA